MSNLLAAQMKWQVYRFAERLSFMAKLALVLLVAVLLSYVWASRPLQSNLAHLIAMQKSGAQLAVAPPANASAYFAQFPKVATRAAKINALIDIAKQQNILLDEVTYKSDTDSNQLLNRYQVAFSVFVPYSEVHHFLSSVLVEMPYVAVDSLNISRENVLDEVVEARVQLTFYFANTR